MFRLLFVSLLPLKRRCVIICNLLRCYQDSGSVIYISKFPTSCILHILTYHKKVVSNESF